ncbi:MAG: calcium/sodium antiporter [Ignavibacteriales bacterium]|nr:calcium/sodium antiporter [Ignavibacteriales bacterium]MCF8305714.1 calcium/sodium antiporter [Ignavibacteriales bacterium]MCF8315436.1 calcium/sodium antiporter [Ignavibacteriales bacterium]MCF8437036.1 calcium/sodium antiporter [Ignavibacteriales bacterium]
MELFISIIILLVTLAGLWKGADILVDSATAIAQRFGISDLVIGLTVVAIATSAPEFVVTISAALAGKDGISVGNVVGSNIFNLYFILGLVAVLSVVPTSRKLVYRDGSVLIGTTLLLLLFLSDLTLERWEGIIMIGILIFYVTYLILAKESSEEIERMPFTRYTWMLFILGTGIVVTSGHFFVTAASDIARFFGLSEWAIGVTIVAAGTSTPEMAASIVALVKKRYGMSAGNLVGSDIFNLLGVLGLAALLNPLNITSESFGSLGILTFGVFVVVAFMRTGWKLSKTEGVILLAVVAVRWYFDLSR